MNKQEKPKVMASEEDALGATSTSSRWGHNVKARHIYEGSDSEEEEEEIPVGRIVETSQSIAHGYPSTESGMAYIVSSFISMLKNTSSQATK
jgi:hypothetical protein